MTVGQPTILMGFLGRSLKLQTEILLSLDATDGKKTATHIVEYSNTSLAIRSVVEGK